MTTLVKPQTGKYWMDFFNNEFTGFSNEFKTPVLVNTKETKDKYVIEVAAPGWEKENFKIEVDNQLLTLSAEKTSEQLQEGERYTRNEFRFSSFKRAFTLPKTVDGAKIGAEYKNGILFVTLPKMEEARAKEKFEVKVA
ncbi:MAG: Hsp20/alpha crystallin family protein [Chitinophagales bacterium]